ncbi:MAG: hypothetical protein ACREIC_03250, partial [Limisphaerales bacterium]
MKLRWQILQPGGSNLYGVSKLHYIIEVPCGVVATDVEKGQLAWVASGDLFKTLDAFKFTLKRTNIIKMTAPNDFGRAQNAGRLAASQPYLP